jgi:hypothetical protein
VCSEERRPGKVHNPNSHTAQCMAAWSRRRGAPVPQCVNGQVQARLQCGDISVGQRRDYQAGAGHGHTGCCARSQSRSHRISHPDSQAGAHAGICKGKLLRWLCLLTGFHINLQQLAQLSGSPVCSTHWAHVAKQCLCAGCQLHRLLTNSWMI